jgi:hypothetical protein
MPLSHLIALISNAHLCLPDRRTRRRMRKPGHTRLGEHCRKTRIFHQDRPGALADLAISPSPSTQHTLRHAALSGVAGIASNPGVSPLHIVTDRSASSSGSCGNLFSYTWMVRSDQRANIGGWWSQTGSNRRPEACKATALPAELWPQSFRDHASLPRPNTATPTAQQWWAWEDLNFRPHAYQARALTN